MPIIPTKTISLDFDFLQIRHICCEKCHIEFFYLREGSYSIEEEGVNFSGTERKLRAKVASHAERVSQSEARKPQQGCARCPHCKHLQRWMVKAINSGNYGCFFGLTCIPAVSIALLAASWYVLVSVFAIAGLFALFGSSWIHSTLGNYKPSLEQSASPDDFKQLLEEALAQGEAPEYVWKRSLSNYSPPRKHLIPILPYGEPGLRKIGGY